MLLLLLLLRKEGIAEFNLLELKVESTGLTLKFVSLLNLNAALLTVLNDFRWFRSVQNMFAWEQLEIP